MHQNPTTDFATVHRILNSLLHGSIYKNLEKKIALVLATDLARNTRSSWSLMQLLTVPASVGGVLSMPQSWNPAAVTECTGLPSWYVSKLLPAWVISEVKCIANS